jgi:hypothetical protein
LLLSKLTRHRCEGDALKWLRRSETRRLGAGRQ